MGVIFEDRNGNLVNDGGALIDVPAIAEYDVRPGPVRRNNRLESLEARCAALEYRLAIQEDAMTVVRALLDEWSAGK